MGTRFIFIHRGDYFFCTPLWTSIAWICEPNIVSFAVRRTAGWRRNFQAAVVTRFRNQLKMVDSTIIHIHLQTSSVAASSLEEAISSSVLKHMSLPAPIQPISLCRSCSISILVAVSCIRLHMNFLFAPVLFL